MPPSFIFIAVDDLNIYNTVLGALPGNFLQKIYPDPDTRAKVLERLTPNIEELASQSLTFTRAFCAAPLCGPSRTALLTGIPPHVSGYYQHDKHFRGYETLTDVVTLPQYLRMNGYYTSGVGKIFHKGRSYLDRGVFSDWPDQIYSWTDWLEEYTGTGTAHDSEVSPLETISRYWPVRESKSMQFTRFGVTSLPREQSNDYRNAKHISDLITTGRSVRTDLRGETKTITVPGNQPYFLACGLFAPHLPWVVPREFYDLFPQEEMSIDQSLLDWVREDIKDLSPTGQEWTRNTSFTRLIEWGLKIDGEGGDINAWKAAFQAYLATVAFSDRNVGVLLDAVKNNPRKANTIVILWSDHGYHIGDKNREGKTTLWEGANHCNLIIYDPRMDSTRSGIRTRATVSLQDLYPTVVDLAGLDRPEHIYGYSLVPLMENPQKEWDHPVLNTQGEGNHSLRTDRFRFIRFKNGDTELYDLVNDPYEVVNLAKDPGHTDIVVHFNQRLDEKLEMGPDSYR